jgi:hypothetical protein
MFTYTFYTFHENSVLLITFHSKLIKISSVETVKSFVCKCSNHCMSFLK